MLPLSWLIFLLSAAALLLWLVVLVVVRHRIHHERMSVALRVAVAATFLAYLGATAVVALAYALGWHTDLRDLLTAASRVVPLVGGLYAIALLHVER